MSRYRSVPCDASPAMGVARDDPDGERQEQRDTHSKGHEDDEEPVVLDAIEERGPGAAAARASDPDGDRDQDGHGGERRQHRPGATTPEQHREFGAEQRETARRPGSGEVGSGELSGQR